MLGQLDSARTRARPGSSSSVRGRNFEPIRLVPSLSVYSDRWGRDTPKGRGPLQTELVERARGGDREAFAVLASGCVDRLHAVARLILRDADLAQDATQDALVRAWRDLPTLREVDRFDAWLHRIIVRSCSDVAKRRRQWRQSITALPVEPAAPDQTAALAERDQLESGLRSLTSAHQRILVLHFYLDLAPSELAEALDIPVGTAKSRLHYAVEALRAALAADERRPTRAVQEGRSA